MLVSILVIFFTSISYTYANSCEWSCKIADAPSTELLEYFENLEKILSKVIDASSNFESKKDVVDSKNEDIWVEEDISSTKNRVLWGLNQILSFKEYYGSFDYWITLGITNEIPAPVKRDHKKLEDYTEKLSNILKISSKRWSGGAKIEDLCEGINNCKISSKNVTDTLIVLINNNKNIVSLMQGSILWKPALYQDIEALHLVWKNFKTSILSDYNKDTLLACSKCEWWTFENFKERIQNISFKNSSYEEWVEKWKAAWALLRWWTSNPWYAEYEKNLLSDYLQGQWLNTEQSDIILWNLDRYGESGYSSNDPLSNSTNYSVTNIEEDTKSFQQSLLERFEWRDKVPIVELAKVNSKIKETSDISKEIHSLFEDQKPYAFTQDTVSQELQARLIRMHFSLLRSINALEKRKWLAVKVCDSAGPKWICDYSK